MRFPLGSGLAIVLPIINRMQNGARTRARETPPADEERPLRADRDDRPFPENDRPFAENDWLFAETRDSRNRTSSRAEDRMRDRRRAGRPEDEATSAPHIKIVPLRTAMAPPDGAPTAVPIKRANYHVIFDRVSYARDKKGKKPPVFRDMSALLPVGRRIAIFGNTGNGKSMLLNLIAGVLQPDRGSVYRSRSISWPFGSSVILDASISVRANVAFFAGAFGLSFERTYDFVCYFADHPPSRNRAIRDLEGQVKRTAASALAMAADYQCYLLDDRLPDKGLDSTRADFVHKFLLRKDLIFTTSSLPQASMLCDVAGVIEGGRLRFFRDLEEAAAVMERTPAFSNRPSNEDGDFDGEDAELIL